MLVALAALSLASSPLAGVWDAPCAVAHAQDHDYGLLDTVTMDDDHFERVSRAYNTTDCKTLGSVNTLQGTYKISADEAGLATFDLTLEHLIITPHDRWIVFFFNQATFCGFRDWASGQPKDVTGLQCGDTRMPGRGDVFYDVYDLTADGTLYFGEVTDRYDRRAPGRRPVALDATQPFRRGED